MKLKVSSLVALDKWGERWKTLFSHAFQAKHQKNQGVALVLLFSWFNSRTGKPAQKAQRRAIGETAWSE
jgi:hypothetical protein